MWFEEADEIAELFRGYFPYYLLIALPIFIIIAPANPVAAAHDFPVYRMQQFDLHGAPHGCRSAPMSIEARPLNGWGTSRHCVLARLQDLTFTQFREIASKAGGLLLVLPENLSTLSNHEKQNMIELEEALMMEEVSIPVYFANWTPELEAILRDISQSFTDGRVGSAAEALLNSVSANGYQIAVASGQASAKSDVSVANIQGKLSGYGVEDKLPTIAIVAHYDSFGIAPELSFGGDSNGSGVAMLLELARLFSHLYTNSRTHARFNILFLLSGAGKFNYQGSKKWLEDQLDGLEGNLLQEASYTLCLDSVSSSDALYLHVSKPPRDGSPGALYIKEMKSVADSLYRNISVETVHKKINLADDLLAWEHERHSIRRLPAFTLSALQSHKDPSRSTIFDVRDSVDIKRLTRNTRVVAEALARHIYNLSVEEVFSNVLGVEEESIEAWIDFLATQPRSAQLLAEKQNFLVITLQDVFSRYLKEVKVTYLVPDKRDPEFVFYDVTKSVVNIYSVKPAVFDLFLTIAIVGYLALIYLFIQNFPLVYIAVSRFVNSAKSKSQ